MCVHNNNIIIDFFEFGNGDSVGPKEVDAAVSLVPLPVPIVMFQEEQRRAYVSLMMSRTMSIVHESLSCHSLIMYIHNIINCLPGIY